MIAVMTFILSALTAHAQVPSVFGVFAKKTSAPSFIQSVEVPWSTTAASISTTSINVQAGDVLVAYAGAENGSSSAALGISGGSLSWTLHQGISLSSPWALAYIWSATVDTNKSMTVTFTVTGATPRRGGAVLVFRNSSGVGASAQSNVNGTAPSLNLTTTKANSAIVVFNADWNAVAGTGRTWLTGAGALTETSYDYISTVYTIFGGYHASSGPASTYTVGLSAPGGQKYSIVALEVKGL